MYGYNYDSLCMWTCPCKGNVCFLKCTWVWLLYEQNYLRRGIVCISVVVIPLKRSAKSGCTHPPTYFSILLHSDGLSIMVTVVCGQTAYGIERSRDLAGILFINSLKPYWVQFGVVVVVLTRLLLIGHVASRTWSRSFTKRSEWSKPGHRSRHWRLSL